MQVKDKEAGDWSERFGGVGAAKGCGIDKYRSRAPGKKGGGTQAGITLPVNIWVKHRGGRKVS